MKNIYLNVLCALFVLACKLPVNQEKKAIKIQEMHYFQQARQTILAWNRFHHIEKMDSFATIYADSLWFYSLYDCPKTQCIAIKKQDFLKYKFYEQTIDSLNISTVYQDSNKIFIHLKKTVNVDGKNHYYSAYFHLAWDKTLNRYLIVHESDAITDQNLEIREVANKQIYEIGDYNGDGKKEKMWLRRGKYTAKLFLYSVIEFSDKKIPSIVLENCTGGVPRNEGDLDADSTDEISLVPGWISSDLTGMNVFTYKNQKWQTLIPSIPCRRHFLQQGYDSFDEKLYQKIVEKGDSTAKWVWIYPQEWDENFEQEVFKRKKQKIMIQAINRRRK